MAHGSIYTLPTYTLPTPTLYPDPLHPLDCSPLTHLPWLNQRSQRQHNGDQQQLRYNPGSATTQLRSTTTQPR
ncbi:unnamed protein product, partial [Ilex paraguariensis]